MPDADPCTTTPPGSVDTIRSDEPVDSVVAPEPVVVASAERSRRRLIVSTLPILRSAGPEPYCW
jgi:hypothetical protein